MAKKKMTLEEAIVKESPYEIPNNWIWTNLKNIGELVTGNTPSKNNSDFYGSEIAFIKPTDLNQGRNLNVSTEYLSLLGASKARLLPKGSTCVCCIGATIGKVAYLNIEGATNQQINSIIPNKINDLYVYYYTLSNEFNYNLIGNSSSTTLPIINKSRMGELTIPIAPLKEQQRIVDKIESLFEKLDKANELIEEAREDFEKRKTAILERAFRGELTKEWRRKNNIIRSEERSKLGDIVKINPKRDKLTDIDDNKECTFVPMPSVSEITGVVEKPLVEKYSKVKKGYTYFKENDVIFAKITPCMENGKSAIVTNLIDGFGFGSTEFHVIRCNENVLNRFVYHLVRSKFFRDSASQHMTGAVGQRRVPKNFLEEYEIILPILQEQKEIVRILDKLLEEESKIEELTKLQEQIELIKKSILAKAFRGQLGTNSEDDESAIELLKEILNK